MILAGAILSGLLGLALMVLAISDIIANTR